MKNAIAVFMGAMMIWGFAQADSIQISQLPDGAKYLSNKIVIVNEASTPGYLVGQTQAGFAYSSVASVDQLCRQIGVIKIEPFYPGMLKNPILREEISKYYIFTLADGVEPLTVLSKFKADPNIKFAEIYSVPEACYEPNDPRRYDQWHLQFTHAFEAWDTVRGDTTKYSQIGIIDSGVHWDHPDLAANIWINAGEDINHNGIFDSGDNNGVDDDNNGFVDDVVGWDFGDNDNNPIDDAMPHGTAVAGCASEVTDNSLQGAAIGFSAKMMCVKVFQGGMLLNAYQGILYAAENGANIINCSWATTTHSDGEQDIVNTVWQMGVLVVASAGGLGNDTPVYPAAYNHVMAVASTDQSDHRPPFSGYGSWVDICAPGVDIWTTYGSSDFTEYSGTSFSAPMVAGLAALIHAWRPTLSNDGIEHLIEVTADTVPNNNGQLGAGRINCVAWLMQPQYGCAYIPGDINENGTADAVDVTFAVNFLKGRRVPQIDCSADCPGHGTPFFAAGDVNGNCEFNGVDITYWIKILWGWPMISCPDCPPRER